MRLDTRTGTYLAIAFGWTWALWIGGFLLGRASGNEVETDATVFEVFGGAGSPGLLPQLLFLVAVYGPLLGYLVARRYRPFWGRPTWPIVLLAVAVPVVSITPAFLLTLLTGVPAEPAAGASVPGGSIPAAIGLYFVSNLLTSGTEEFGWRGYLYPWLRERERTFWGAAWKGGLVWAVWHYPLMVILYWDLGVVVLLPTLVGFTASIVAMNYITNFVYERSDSIALAMLLHALNNTAGFALILLFPTTPFTIVSALMAWAFVGFLEWRYKIDAKVETAERAARPGRPRRPAD